MLKAMVVDHDIAEYRRIIESIGMLKPGNDVHRRGGAWTTSATSTTSCSATRSARSRRSTRPRPCAGSSTTAATTAEILRAANVPPTFVIIQRINLGLYAIFGQLRATANWRRISEEIWPFVDGAADHRDGRAGRGVGRGAGPRVDRGHRPRRRRHPLAQRAPLRRHPGPLPRPGAPLRRPRRRRPRRAPPRGRAPQPPAVRLRREGVHPVAGRDGHRGHRRPHPRRATCRRCSTSARCSSTTRSSCSTACARPSTPSPTATG